MEDLNTLLTNEQRLVFALSYQGVTDAVKLEVETKETVESIEEGVKQLSTAVQESAKLQADARLIENLRHTLKATAVASLDEWCSLFRRRLLTGSGSWDEPVGPWASLDSSLMQ